MDCVQEFFYLNIFAYVISSTVYEKYLVILKHVGSTSCLVCSNAVTNQLVAVLNSKSRVSIVKFLMHECH